jgi:hypothetical protein
LSCDIESGFVAAIPQSPCRLGLRALRKRCVWVCNDSTQFNRQQQQLNWPAKEGQCRVSSGTERSNCAKSRAWSAQTRTFPPLCTKSVTGPYDLALFKNISGAPDAQIDGPLAIERKRGKIDCRFAAFVTDCQGTPLA